MRNMWTIASREYKHYFSSPVAYVVAFMFLGAVGIVFALNILDANQSALYYSTAPDVSAVTAPICVPAQISTEPGLTQAVQFIGSMQACAR